MTPGRTVEHVAAIIDAPPSVALELLDELRAAGHVEEAAGGWRLTAEAERRFGRALRSLPPAGDLREAAHRCSRRRPGGRR